ncbi:MAG TPA: hypothetical protein VK760_03315 [Candidatus Acidoferrales bacterium]|nr:hypothetical protein [Candidatus Acidoferrales bacterium]
MHYRFLCAVCFAMVASTMPSQALAWGTTGHREVNLVAARSLPPSLPAFLRTPEAIAEIEALGPEEDRLKGSGESWDRDYDPGHFADIGDDGTIFGARLDALPADMGAYAKALASAGSDPYRAGYLPYSIVDGWEQVREDFAYWRAFDYLATHAAAGDRAAYAAARDLRQALTLRDIGVWGHFVGDGSQPLHVSVHYNGWGSYPNPNGYTTEKIHSLFEGAFVRDHVTAEAVAQQLGTALPAPAPALLSQEQILAMTGAYLKATAANVPTLYTIEKAGGFQHGSPEAIAFTTARVADGARELRDLIVLAWDNSQYASIGYPPIAVQDILRGSVTPSPGAFGSD